MAAAASKADNYFKPTHSRPSPAANALPPASRSASQAGWQLTDAVGAPVSMASVAPHPTAMRGRSELPANRGSGRGLAGIREESHGDSPKPPRRRTTSPRRANGPPHSGRMEDDPRGAHEVPVPAEVIDLLEVDPAGRSVADAMAADEAAALAAEAAAHKAQDAHNALAQAAMHGTAFSAAA